MARLLRIKLNTKRGVDCLNQTPMSEAMAKACGNPVKVGDHSKVGQDIAFYKFITQNVATRKGPQKHEGVCWNVANE